MPATASKKRARKKERTTSKNVLLTGAHNFLGKLVLKKLQAEKSISKIIIAGEGPLIRGAKVKNLKKNLTETKLIETIQKEKVHTLIHLGLSDQGKRETRFERNVMGTINLLGAAAEANIKHVIIRSNYTYYGAWYKNPNFIPETKRSRRGISKQTVRDVGDIERYATEFSRYAEDTIVTRLRFSPVVGPTANGAFMKYLQLDLCPIIMGFDPLIQLLHEEDAAEAVLATYRKPYDGPVNVAPEGVEPLMKILRFLGKEMVNVPQLPLESSEKLMSMLKTLPFDPGFLRFNCCLEYERLHNEVGFIPTFTSAESLRAIEEKF